MSKLEAKIILSGVDNASRPLQNTTKSTRLLSEQLLKTKAELKALNQVQKDVSGFVQLKNNTQKVSTELEQARNKVNSLAQALKQTSSPTQKMADDFEKAKRKAAQLKDSFNNLRVATQNSVMNWQNLELIQRTWHNIKQHYDHKLVAQQKV